MKTCPTPLCGKEHNRTGRFCARCEKRRQREGLARSYRQTFRARLVEAALRLAEAEEDHEFALAAENLEQIARRGREARAA